MKQLHPFVLGPYQTVISAVRELRIDEQLAILHPSSRRINIRALSKEIIRRYPTSVQKYTRA